MNSQNDETDPSPNDATDEIIGIPHTPRSRGFLARLRTSFLTGLVVIAPVGVTVWIVWTVARWIDGVVLPLVPVMAQPSKYIGVDIPGIGLAFFLVFTVIVGWLASLLIGRWLIGLAESLVDRMPIVRSIYSGIKQISQTVFAQTERNFEKAAMIEYPRRGIWAIGFISTEAKGEIARRHPEDRLLSVFVPTTPNPTSGFLLYLPAQDVVELDMSVEDAAKLVISAGLVYPPGRKAAPEVPPLPDGRAGES